jgi:phosphodiesterase/alkaline phosphatase D-like protein
VTEPASSITQTAATLNATVNPNGGEVSKCEFEYGTTKSYGSTAPCSSLPGSGTSPVAVSASVTGLAANTTYHFRISATNASGTSKGADQKFETPPNPPTVVTGLASS